MFLCSTMKNKGFTVIEVIVVVAILTVLMVGILVAVVPFGESRSTQNDAKRLMAKLKLLQSRTTAVEIPSGCTGFGGYTISFVDGEGTIDVTASCQAGSYSESVEILKSSVFYNSPADLVINSPDGTSNALDIDICGGSTNYQITTTESGSITGPVEIGAC